MAVYEFFACDQKLTSFKEAERKFIYKVMGLEKVVSHLAGYIGKYADAWKELELWRVMEDDYSVDSSEVPQTVIYLHNLTVEKIETFFDGPVPRRLLLVQG